MADSSNIIGIEIDSNAKSLLAELRGLPTILNRRVAARIDLENQETIAQITVQRMNFPSNGPTVPDGLRRITSTAVRSLRATKAVILGELDIESSIGSNLIYLRAQEEGFNGRVMVPPYTRRKFKYSAVRTISYIDPATKVRMTKQGRTRKDTKQDVQVSAHQMLMNLPARHMIRDGIQDRAENYGAAISVEIRRLWDETGDNAQITGGAL